jgi:hypothetical protein
MTDERNDDGQNQDFLQRPMRDSFHKNLYRTMNEKKATLV